MAIAVDTSTPANADQPTGTVATVTSPSFTPPANSLVLALWSGNAPTVTTTNATATITDSLASHLTYTLVQKANPTTTSTTTTGGDAYIWWAKVTTSAAMTVSVTTGATASKGSGLQVVVLTGTDLTTPVATSGVGAAATAPTTITQNYTPTQSAGMGFLVFTDWNDSTSAPPAAGTGCTRISGVAAANITYGTYRRTSPDDVSGTANTVRSGTWTGPDPALWAWVDIQPPVATDYTATPADIMAANDRLPPVPPDGLTATVVSSTEIDLAWSMVAGAVSYDVERDGAVISTGQTGRTLADTGRTASTTYNYNVRSVY